jgi:predicted acyl esterase
MLIRRFALLLSVSAVCLSAQGLEFVKANYTKYEYLIPMRDGVHLFTAVYVPKDAAAEAIHAGDGAVVSWRLGGR